MLIGVDTCLNNKICKKKIDDNSSNGEKNIEPGMAEFPVLKFEQWNKAFDDPEKNDSTCHQKRALPGLNMFKEMDHSFHEP